MNYLDIVNSVLRKVREDEVLTADESEYSKVIEGFVLATKREMESAHQWSTLRTTIALSVTTGDPSWSMTGAGKRYTVDDIYDATNNVFLLPIMAIQGRRKNADGDSGTPTHYWFEGVDSSGDAIILLTPEPNDSFTINCNLFVPQTDTLADGDEVTMDEWPIILGAYAKAVAERGEDQGRTSGEMLQQYQSALADAIGLDIARNWGEDVWHV